MRRIGIGLLALLFVLAARAADDKDKPDKKAAPAEELQALEQEFQKAQQQIFERAIKAKSDDDRAAFGKEMRQLTTTFTPRFLKLAEKNAKDPAAVDALLWVMQHVEMGKEADTAAEMIIENHLNSAKVKQSLQRFAQSQSSAAEKLLRAAMKVNEVETQAVATFALAQYLKSRAELPTLLASLDEATLKQVEGNYGKQFLEDLRKVDSEKMTKEVETLLETVEKKFAEVGVNNQPLGEQVKPMLFELRNLAVGKVAPEIEGEDLDGKKFKLSDYRGKVVALDFWGNW
jgi:hypothetical protein